ncbi:MAG: hypothetical protein HQK83_00310 [Fibrobacteria bacterium]|nr:hypothetical protein [Fibrobacteria bacterium]
MNTVVKPELYKILRLLITELKLDVGSTPSVEEIKTTVQRFISNDLIVPCFRPKVFCLVFEESIFLDNNKRITDEGAEFIYNIITGNESGLD